MSNENSLVIKIGGKFFDLMQQHPTSVADFFTHLQQLVTSGRRIILVHGGGTQVSELISNLGRQSHKIDGLRVTPDDDIDIVTGVLAGHLNKRLVARCKSLGLAAVGMSLADGDIATCQKVSDQLGWVGEPVEGNNKLLNTMLSLGIIPVIATIGCDDKGNLYNVNADHGALHLARILNAELMLLSDVPGVLDQHQQLLPELDRKRISTLIEQQIITDGMLVKVNAAEKVASALNRNVIIASWHNLNGGTRIVPTCSKEPA